MLESLAPIAEDGKHKLIADSKLGRAFYRTFESFE